MASLWQTAVLLKKWHYSKLSAYEKRFINEIVEYAGDGSDNPKDSVLMADNQVTDKMANLLRGLGKRFLINEHTVVEENYDKQ